MRFEYGEKKPTWFFSMQETTILSSKVPRQLETLNWVFIHTQVYTGFSGMSHETKLYDNRGINNQSVNKTANFQ